MIRKLSVLGPAYLCGMLLASVLASWLSCTAGGLFLCFGAVCLLYLRPDHGSRAFAASAAALSLGFGMLLYGGYDLLVYRPIVSDSGSEFSGYVRVSEVRKYSSGSCLCIAECRFPCGIKGKAGWFAEDGDIAEGDTVKLSGTLYSPENTGFFDTKDYYAAENVFLMLENITEEEVFPNENSIYRRMDEFRGRVCAQIRKYIPSDEGELIIGMVFGKRCWDMPYRTEKALYRSGIGHIASVSGLHIGMAAGIASALAAALEMTKKQRLALVMAFCFVYGAMADFTVSVRRALIMIAFIYCADLFKRQNDPLSSLCTAAFLITAGSPFSVRSASFLLSFSGVFGAAVMAPAVTEGISDAYEKRMKKELVFGSFFKLAASSVCASLSVIPASVFCFDELSVLAPLTNILLSPFYTAGASIAVSGALLSVFGMPWLSGGLFISAGLICRIVMSVAVYVGEMPAAAIPTGLEIVPPVTAAAVTVSLFSMMLAKRQTAVIISSAAVLIAAVCMTAFRLIPKDITEIYLLTDGSGYVLIISENNSVSIFDSKGGKRGADAAERLIIGKGLGKTGMVCLGKKCETTAPYYRERFPETHLASSEDIGLTYSPENNIIVYGGVRMEPHEGYQVIETNGIRILCLEKKCDIPKERFDLCIYDCRGDLSADSGIHAVTRKGFGGKFSPSDRVYFCESGSFSVRDGKIWERNERKWLR